MADLDRLAAIGQRVRAAREAAGLTQADLAAKVGRTRVSITNIESGRQGNIPVTLIIGIAAALGIDVQRLVCGGPGHHDPDQPRATTARVSRSVVSTMVISTPYVSDDRGITLGLVRDLIEAATAAGVAPTEPIRITRDSRRDTKAQRMEIVIRTSEGGDRG